jgi:hypothetical protein
MNVAVASATIASDVPVNVIVPGMAEKTAGIGHLPWAGGFRDRSRWLLSSR